MKKKPLFITIAIILLLIGIYAFTGFFVIQPIGAIPDGVTIWYLRYNTNLPFISSADSLSLEYQGGVSLLSRSVLLGTFAETSKGKIIARLPYMDFLYSISTNGRSFEN